MINIYNIVNMSEIILENLLFVATRIINTFSPLYIFNILLHQIKNIIMITISYIKNVRI